MTGQMLLLRLFKWLTQSNIFKPISAQCCILWRNQWLNLVCKWNDSFFLFQHLALMGLVCFKLLWDYIFRYQLDFCINRYLICLCSSAVSRDFFQRVKILVYFGTSWLLSSRWKKCSVVVETLSRFYSRKISILQSFDFHKHHHGYTFQLKQES